MTNLIIGRQLPDAGTCETGTNAVRVAHGILIAAVEAILNKLTWLALGHDHADGSRLVELLIAH